MTHMTHAVRMSLVFLTSVSLVACAPFLENHRSWQPSAGTRAIQTDLQPSIGYYESAVAAINARRYVLALEYLQTARAQKPDDVRVLTAFGVVYDKLGRFDLSARYYSQAAAVDPQSKIVAANLDYSRRLQGFTTAETNPRLAMVAPDAAEGVLPPAVAGVAQIQVAGALSTPIGAKEEHVLIRQTKLPAAADSLSKTGLGAPANTKAVFLTGHPLKIVDASGRGDVDRSVRSYLTGLGWTLAKGEAPKAPGRPETVILYGDSMITAAKALARTLSLPMRLTVSSDVQGLQLVLGGDISGVNLAGRAQRPPRRQLALVSANTEKRE
ncbi:MAG: LytR C-terminal domain-containing protein [Pseudomonadota bacterium]